MRLYLASLLVAFVGCSGASVASRAGTDAGDGSKSPERPANELEAGALPAVDAAASELDAADDSAEPADADPADSAPSVDAVADADGSAGQKDTGGPEASVVDAGPPVVQCATSDGTFRCPTIGPVTIFYYPTPGGPPQSCSYMAPTVGCPKGAQCAVLSNGTNYPGVCQ